MVVCKFYLQGNCRFGANCRYDHPSGQGGSSGGGGGGGGFGGQNRFGALSNNNNNSTSNRFGGASARDNSKPYTLNVPDIKSDLTRGQSRPQWILSTYGAGRNTPGSLFEGNEFSPEELRVRFYEMASAGKENEADQEAIQLWSKAEQDMDNAVNHLDDIPKFMEEAEQKHPNRYDFLKADGTKTREEVAKAAEQSNTTSSGFGAPSAFGQSNNSSNPFAKPAAATFGQQAGPSAFGGSAFGKPAQPSAFGQSAFGQSGFGNASPAFGQPSSPFGQNNSNNNTATNTPFGQSAAASAFGKPAFGQSAFGKSAFGQPAQPSTASAFGQPAQPQNQPAFGQPASGSGFGTAGFGQPAKPSLFAAPSAGSGFGSTTAFGQPAQSTSAFGQPAQPSQTPSAFGQPSQPASAFGQTSQPASAFGQSAFGKPAQPSAFGQSNFGQPAQPASSSPFGQGVSAPSGFGIGGGQAPAFGQPTQQNASPFGQPNTNEVSMSADVASTATQQAQAPANPFGTPQSSVPTTQPASTTQAAAAPPTAVPNKSTSQTPHTLTSQPPKPLHYTQTLPLIPSQNNMSKRLTSYRGQPVRYLDDDTTPCYNRPDGKGPEKIWFPEAGSTLDVVALNREDKLKDLQLDDTKYDEQVKDEYKHLFETGGFKDGKMPLVPPVREWCLYDF